MKLNSSVFGAILTGLALWVAAGVGYNTYTHLDNFLAETHTSAPAPRALSPMPQVADTPAVLIPGVYGWGARTMLDRCNMDTVFVYRALDAAGWDSVNNILETGPHRDTAKLVIGGTGGRASTGFGGDNADCVYWAGHTAQGGGVEIQNDYNSLRHLRWDDPDNHDFVVRGFAFSNPARDANSSVPMKNIENISGLLILENFNYGGVETTGWDFGPTSASDTIKEVTIWRETVALCGDEPVAFGLTNGTAGGYISQLSFGQVVYQSCSHRLPLLDTDATGSPTPQARIVGQLIYNQRQGAALTSGWYMDLLDQYTMPGPFTDTRYWWGGTLYTNQTWSDESRVYADRLIGPQNRDTSTIPDSLWADGGAFQEIACYYRQCNDPGGGGDPRDSLGPGVKVDTPQTGPTYPLERVDPFSDVRVGLVGTTEESAGNYQYLNCSGVFTFRSDSLREALFQEIRDSTGIATSVDSAYMESRDHYTRSAGSSCADTDNDGMFDGWETNEFGDLTANNSSDPDADGYPNWLEFVNGTDPNTFTAYDGTEGGGGGGGGGPTPTYGSDRWVVRAPTVDFCPPTGACSTSAPVGLLGSWVTDNDSLLTHATEAGSDRVHVVISGQISGSNPDQDSVQSGGINMTEVASYNDLQVTWLKIKVFMLDESEVSSRSGSDVEVFWNAVPSNEFLVSGFFENVNQTTPVGDTATAGSGGSTTNISTAALSTANEDLVVAAAAGGNPGTATTWSWNNSFVEATDFSFGSDYQFSNATKAATGANETPDASPSSTHDRAMMAGLVLQTSGAGPAPSDTIPNLPNTDSIPPGDPSCAGLFFNNDSSEVLCVAFAADTPSVTAQLLDSTAADSTCNDAAWSCTPAELKAVTISWVRELFGRFAGALWR